MNFQVFLSKILDIANFPRDKRQKFLEIFYQYYFVRLIDAIGGVDPVYAQRMTTVVDNMKANPQAFGELWRELMGKEEFRLLIEQVTDEVVGYLVDDVMKSASDDERVQIQRLMNG